jgi:hypothetical protein
MIQNVLLLTATITPTAGVRGLARSDPEKRRGDYMRAFRFYIDMLGSHLDRIIFVENSATDIADFALVARELRAADRVEFVSYYGLDYPDEYGRGYGEFMLIDHAAEHSETIRAAGEDLIVWKMTGRYITRNLPRLIATRPRAFDLYCNLRNHPYRWVNIYMMAWNRLGYEKIIKGIAPQLRMDLIAPPELPFRRVVDEARGRYNVVPRFRYVPIIDGVRGTDDRSYTEGERWKIAARQIARTVAPWLWI